MASSRSVLRHAGSASTSQPRSAPARIACTDPTPDASVHPVNPAVKRDSVRLAELVSALSLGIDLGFGQPMEHVLRQCLIALRLADSMGLATDQRATVYYTALLVNVGC